MSRKVSHPYKCPRQAESLKTRLRRMIIGCGRLLGKIDYVRLRCPKCPGVIIMESCQFNDLKVIPICLDCENQEFKPNTERTYSHYGSTSMSAVG